MLYILKKGKEVNDVLRKKNGLADRSLRIDDGKRIFQDWQCRPKKPYLICSIATIPTTPAIPSSQDWKMFWNTWPACALKKTISLIYVPCPSSMIVSWNFLKDYRFRGDVYAFKEGSIVYPEEPLITIVAPCSMLKSLKPACFPLSTTNPFIATKANRIVLAAKGRTVSDFGARRSHGFDAAFFGAKASYIGGVNSTATVLAGKRIPYPRQWNDGPCLRHGI